MKNNYRRLGRLLKIFGEDAFYTLAISENDIRVQGFYHDELFLLAESHKFIFNLTNSDDHFTRLNRGNITIVLT